MHGPMNVKHDKYEYFTSKSTPMDSSNFLSIWS